MKKIILNGNVAFAIYNYRYGLMKELSKQGYEVVCVAQADDSVKKIQEENWRFVEIAVDRRGKSILNDLKQFFEYIKIFKREKPEYVLNFTVKPNIYGTLAAKVCNIPAINNITGLGDTFSLKPIITFIVTTLYKLSFKFPKKVFFQNNDDMELFLDKKLIKKEKCVRIPGSGVNLENFRPSGQEKKDKKIRFLYIGRILERKGIRIINEISKQISKESPNVEFQLLGSISTNEEGHIPLSEIQEWEKESNIVYLGTSTDVRKEIGEADFILFPSYYREGVPRSLIESAAMAKPILTTDNVGCRDIVTDGYNGYLAKPNDVESMLEAVKTAISLTQEERSLLGENGRTKVEQEFDEKIVINRYLENIIKR